MVPTYKELKEILPSDTMELIDTALPYLAKCNKIFCKDINGVFESKMDITFHLLVWAACNNKEYKTLFSNFGFARKNLYLNFSQMPLVLDSPESCYKEHSYILPDLKDPIEYANYTPYDLINRWLDKYCKYNFNRAASSSLFDISMGSLYGKLEEIKMMMRHDCCRLCICLYYFFY